MIKIEHPQLSRIVTIHTEACFRYALPRLNFYIDLFNSLGHNEKIKTDSLCDFYSLSRNETFYSLINPFLIPNKRLKNKKFNIGINEIRTVLTSKQCSIIEDAKSLNKFKSLYDFFINVKRDLIMIISSKPKELYSVILDDKYKRQKDDLIKEVLEKIFSFETLIGNGFILPDGTKWNNYSLTSFLDIPVCPYCNRSWINTVKNGVYKNSKGKNREKLTSPQLDHFFSKGDFPLLRLSFYNLIPSCETCNARLKHKIEFTYDKNLHPYVDGYGTNCKFETSPNDYQSIVGTGTNYDLELNINCNIDAEKKQKVKENHKVFEIDTIYKDHLDIVSEIYRKKAISNDKYMDIILNQFKDSGLSKEELYRLVFGNYYEEVDFKKRPFAKLTKDVAFQLKLIK